MFEKKSKITAKLIKNKTFVDVKFTTMNIRETYVLVINLLKVLAKKHNVEYRQFLNNLISIDKKAVKLNKKNKKNK